MRCEVVLLKVARATIGDEQLHVPWDVERLEQMDGLTGAFHRFSIPSTIQVKVDTVCLSMRSSAATETPRAETICFISSLL